ncbi:DNA damage-inducible protein 1 [Erysiphe neolycopersici]|uniref:DNA damage-inducible protein 1 n=1 Tax=Erysiphe neolycopersici TaxID=212602 RepID=A0A420HVX3_9PEZI|nr:DNA damage-inducible protein 1 [Erysiphe neolycopersici]
MVRQVSSDKFRNIHRGSQGTVLSRYKSYLDAAPSRSGSKIESDLISLEISSNTTVGTLKASVHGETQIPESLQNIYHNGQLLNNESKTMEDLQIGDGELLAIHVRDITSGHQESRRARHSSHQQSTGSGGQNFSDTETIRLHLLGNPAARAQALNHRPELANVLESPERFLAMMRQINAEERLQQDRRQQQIDKLNADPFDQEAQAKIEEIIREERVQENLQNALEYNPEVFGHVHMLYINVEVNGFKVKAFVDSGAQATIMSPSCAENCGIMRLVDKRFAGVARGVGTAAIIGKVHSAQIKIGPLHLPCSFTVMEGKDVDLLLGLDMLKRYQACIDLSENLLIIQGNKMPFLGEADIPKNLEVIQSQESKISGPEGTMIGSKSGVVSSPPVVAHSSTSVPSEVPGAQIPSSQSVEQLMALGFSRNQCLQALEASGGNIEIAAGLLFQG